MEKRKKEKAGKNKSQHFCFLSNNKLGAEKSVTKFFINDKKMERKINGQIKEMISMRRLVLYYTIQLMVSNVCTKCQIPEKSLRQISLCITLE